MDSFNDIELCFVSTFRLNVPFQAESNSDSGLLGAYEVWKADVKSKLKEKTESSSLIWIDPNENLTNRQNFAPGCFFYGKVRNVRGFTCILKTLNVFDNISPEINLLEVRLWKFGIGSVRIKINLKSLSNNDIFRLKENEIIAKLDKFNKILEVLIEHEIIRRCASTNGNDPGRQSFTEEVIKYKKMETEQPIGKLLRHQILFKLNVKDSKFSFQSYQLSKGYYNVCSDKNSPAENFDMYCSNEKDIVVFLQVGNNDSAECFTERILVQVFFLQYFGRISEIYKMFFTANLTKLNQEQGFWSRLILAKMYPKGRESVIVNERKSINYIYKEIEDIEQTIYESNHQVDSLFASSLDVRNSKIWNCISNFFNLDEQQRIADEKCCSIKNQYKRMDKIVATEASTGRVRAERLASILGYLIIFSYRGYQNNVAGDTSISLIILTLIFLYIFRTILNYLAARVFEQYKIFKYRKFKKNMRLSDTQLWLLINQKNKCVCIGFVFWCIMYCFMHGVIFIVELMEWLFWIFMVLAIIYLLWS